MIYQKLQRCRKKLFFAAFAGLLFFSAYLLYDSIPDEIYTIYGEEEKMELSLPVSVEKVEDTVPVFQTSAKTIRHSGILQEYKLSCKFLNLIPVKEVAVHVVDKNYVMPSGMPIGIYTKTSGVLIIGTGKITAADGLNYEPAEQIVKGGDYITSVNGIPVSAKEELMELVDQCSGNPVVLGILRDGKAIEQKVEPVALQDGSYKLGIWVRDDMAGVGTLTFINNELEFGALGHPVSDADTGSLIRLAEGKVYHTNIVGIVKGENGSPGELTGVINYKEENCMGTIVKNTKTGIYGKLNKLPQETAGEYLEVCMKQNIKKGPAYILSSLDGTQRKYQIEIDDIDYNNKEENKGILFHVTDELLMSETGGIVQGM